MTRKRRDSFPELTELEYTSPFVLGIENKREGMENVLTAIHLTDSKVCNSQGMNSWIHTLIVQTFACVAL